jgi:hypothetical protein
MLLPYASLQIDYQKVILPHLLNGVIHSKITLSTQDGSEKLWISFLQYEDVNNPLGPPYKYFTLR